MSYPLEAFHSAPLVIGAAINAAIYACNRERVLSELRALDAAVARRFSSMRSSFMENVCWLASVLAAPFRWLKPKPRPAHTIREVTLHPCFDCAKGPHQVSYFPFDRVVMLGGRTICIPCYQVIRREQIKVAKRRLALTEGVA